MAVCGHRVLGQVEGQVGSLIMTDHLVLVLMSIVRDRISQSRRNQVRNHLVLVLKTFLRKARSLIVVQAADQTALVHLDLETTRFLVSHQHLRCLLVLQNQVHVHQESWNHPGEVVEDPRGPDPDQEAVHQVFGHEAAQETVKSSSRSRSGSRARSSSSRSSRKRQESRRGRESQRSSRSTSSSRTRDHQPRGRSSKKFDDRRRTSPSRRSSFSSRSDKSSTSSDSKQSSSSSHQSELATGAPEPLDQIEDTLIDSIQSTKAMFRIPDVFYYGNSISFLKDLDKGLMTENEQVHATVDSRRYIDVVNLAYTKLLQVRPRLKFLLSAAEWRHVHVVLLYAKMFDCELHFHQIELPEEFQIKIPDDVIVFEPVAAALASIGIVKDDEMGVTFIPVAKPYSGVGPYKVHDPEDVTEFLEWTQKNGLGYDWNHSWQQVEKERQERKQMAIDQGLKVPEADPTATAEKIKEKLTEWEQLAVEKWLGWDDDLWFSYKQACHVLSRIADFVPRPVSETGTYGWLLPRQEKSNEYTVRVPKPMLTPDNWLIALIFNMCALQKDRMTTWYQKTNPFTNIDEITDNFLGAAIKITTSGTADSQDDDTDDADAATPDKEETSSSTSSSF